MKNEREWHFEKEAANQNYSKVMVKNTTQKGECHLNIILQQDVRTFKAQTMMTPNLT